ncbi:DeoR/GlpR family DNA-binding transcription regulator [Microbacterium betulae]|uniref:Lactose phosphotransferase system repressor n=1 Tax=Microbacterium betulae TaxID=2981139 RepID=A0AA97FK80_9MICO|nr:DeoR/GlpR family DNA-binding transcription regulator [Microbacterium sp. AB]WOF23604.1 DeoR/GlpR family DNA-binding transcription regulator [Microbacterium sp. AB]
MYATERRELIEQALSEHSRVAVADLSVRLGVTTETVRRDLAVLEQAGVLRRVHGGAVPAGRGSLAEADLRERSGRHGASKRAIATRALDVLGHDFSGSLLIDAGTTTAALADLLPARLAGARVEIVTHAVAIAAALGATDEIALSVVGGRLRGLTGAAVGASTVEAIDSLRPEIAFVGTNGLTADFGLSTPDPDEADVKRAIVRAARRVILLADASKFGGESLQRFARLDEVDLLVTDREPDDALAEALENAEVEVWVA